MNYSFEIFNPDKDITISFRNLNIVLLNEITKEDSIKNISTGKYYLYNVYDRLEVLGHKFMVLKSTKNNVILLSV